MRRLTEQDINSMIGLYNEGYTIEQARVKGGKFSDSDHYGIALGISEKGNYVTWQFKLNDDNTSFDFYWGHYHMGNREAAIEDFNTREE